MRKIKAWAIARTKDDSLFDDGINAKDGELLVCFPVFRKKSHAMKYKKDTFGNKYARGISKVVPIFLTPQEQIESNKTMR